VQIAAHLPTKDDRAHLDSLETRAIVDQNQYAHWIAPPSHPINRRSIDFEYVRA
jgi:hypothetical protein